MITSIKRGGIGGTLEPVNAQNVILNNHADLQNLDYANSGHTGFASSQDIAAVNAELGNKANRLDKEVGIDLGTNTNEGLTYIDMHAHSTPSEQLDYDVRFMAQRTFTPINVGQGNLTIVANTILHGGYPMWDSGNLPVESGTWTPAIAGCEISIYKATYIRVGRLVYISCYMLIHSTTIIDNNYIRVTGLPFASESEVEHGAILINTQTCFDVNFVATVVVLGTQLAFHDPLTDQMDMYVTNQNLRPGYLVFAGTYQIA